MPAYDNLVIDHTGNLLKPNEAVKLPQGQQYPQVCHLEDIHIIESDSQ